MDGAVSPDSEAADDVPVYLEHDHLAAITEHYEQQFGGPHSIIFHEKTSRFVHIDAYVYQATEQRPFITVATVGMSARPMRENDVEHPCRTELMLYLPPDWDFGSVLGKFPIARLVNAARYPFAAGEIIADNHSLEFEQKPIIPGSLLSGFYFRGAEGSFYRLVLPSGVHCHPLWAVDMTMPELYVLRTEGHEAIDRLLDEHHSVLLDVDRACMISRETREQRRARVRAQKQRRRAPRDTLLEELRCEDPDHVDCAEHG